MASSSSRPCETFLKRSWHRAATVVAALIALAGVPVDDAQARGAARSSQAVAAAEAPAPAGAAVAAAQTSPSQPAPSAGAASAVHEPQPAGTVPVESQPTPPPAAGDAHGAPAAPGEHGAAPTSPAGAAAHGQPPAHGPPAADGHAAQGADHGGAAGGEHESVWAVPARIFNFALLVGGLIYLLRSPLAEHLAARRQQIRGGLESARETSAKATAHLAELDRRLQELPAELEALRKKGVEEIAAEEQRIQAKAEAERVRLIDDLQRDVDVRVRVARKQLAEHAADLAVGLAAERVRQTITDGEQTRLIDRYTSQVKDIHG
jgi:F0F1-type ATP synthase membrane subunit b/b'